MSDSAHSSGRKLLLGIDTCGPSGSVALGEWVEGELRILGETELAGRSYSATLVAAIGELLTRAGVHLDQLHAIVVVNGPGSFTGVRVGLSAVKGLAEGRDSLGVVAVSRLEVLASKANIPSAALDAHRGEIFLRDRSEIAESRELLAGSQELATISPPPARIALCDDSAAELLRSAWPATELVRVEPPTAADALGLSVPRVLAGERVDLAALDGHYLRRSDAEIFGDPRSTELRRK